MTWAGKLWNKYQNSIQNCMMCPIMHNTVTVNAYSHATNWERLGILNHVCYNDTHRHENGHEIMWIIESAYRYTIMKIANPIYNARSMLITFFRATMSRTRPSLQVQFNHKNVICIRSEFVKLAFHKPAYTEILKDLTNVWELIEWSSRAVFPHELVKWLATFDTFPLASGVEVK